MLFFMMMQFWMGFDFINDDLVREFSIVIDYEYELLGIEFLEDWNCYKIKMILKLDVLVVWGEIIIWISKDEYLQLKSEFYDEDGYFVQIIYGKQVREMDGWVIFFVLEVVFVDEEGYKICLEYFSFDFNEFIQFLFFFIQNMKCVK